MSRMLIRRTLFGIFTLVVVSLVVFVALLFYMYLIGSKLSRLEARMRDLSDRETDEGEKK